MLLFPGPLLIPTDQFQPFLKLAASQIPAFRFFLQMKEVREQLLCCTWGMWEWSHGDQHWLSSSTPASTSLQPDNGACRNTTSPFHTHQQHVSLYGCPLVLEQGQHGTSEQAVASSLWVRTRLAALTMVGHRLAGPHSAAGPAGA